MRFLVDTTILVYAVNRDCDEHRPAAQAVGTWLSGGAAWAITWGVVYEFFRVVTHPGIFGRPLTAARALQFLGPILASDLVSVLGPTSRHEQIMRATIREVGRPSGNLFHDLHTAVLMREHGIGEIMTADADFRRFGFLRVTDPVHPSV